MPNWCYTMLSVEGDVKSVQKYRDTITLYTDGAHEARPNQDFGPRWLGNIVENLELTEPNSGYSYRGSICDLSELNILDGGKAQFQITTETAWSPMLWIWTTLQKALGLEDADLKIEYYAEEIGNCLYQASSKEMTDGGDYYIDAFEISDEDMKVLHLPDIMAESGFIGKDELFEGLSYYSGATLDERLSGFSEARDSLGDCYYGINKIEFIPIEEAV